VSSLSPAVFLAGFLLILFLIMVYSDAKHLLLRFIPSSICQRKTRLTIFDETLFFITILQLVKTEKFFFFLLKLTCEKLSQNREEEISFLLVSFFFIIFF